VGRPPLRGAEGAGGRRWAGRPLTVAIPGPSLPPAVAVRLPPASVRQAQPGARAHSPPPVPGRARARPRPRPRPDAADGPTAVRLLQAARHSHSVAFISGGPFGARVPGTMWGGSGGGGRPAPHIPAFKILNALMGRTPKAWPACDNRINTKPKAFGTKPKAPRRVAGMVKVNKRKTESFSSKTESVQKCGRRCPGEESTHRNLVDKNTESLKHVAGVVQVSKLKTENSFGFSRQKYVSVEKRGRRGPGE
jgi:hypothetical protein